MNNRYKMHLIAAHDGDTFRVDVELGMNVWVHNLTCRLARINAPELKNPDGTPNPAGIAAGDYLRNAFAQGGSFELEMLHNDKYNRQDVELWLGDKNINDLMVSSGHAIPYRAFQELPT